MMRFPLALLILASATVGGLYAWARVRSAMPPEGSQLVLIEEAKHLVTPDMAESSRAMLDRPAPGFAKRATDGETHRLDEMLGGGPVLLTFIKKGCPCSEAAQSFFNQLHAAYPKVSMWGVIDQDLEKAKEWAGRFHVPYPLLVAPEEDLIHAYGVENSAYSILVGPRGRIAKHWPGYSEPMLRELGSLMAEMTASPEKPLDLADAPLELYTGCPYDL
ncbi:peroxiredoxin family protein [Paludisphaera mucosa]|uniref:Redoxin domain-containing protein n=1 Tax=Paludisphaera mucosa TaxID=3030827 RepID=A0ABT6FL72_9BACT|nr:redoxin domain-containing protein [Paludisphaera mucosa]MDG3008325.1 redoxin domain-containing protein [Paludisphaera mucosa]